MKRSLKEYLHVVKEVIREIQDILAKSTEGIVWGKGTRRLCFAIKRALNFWALRAAGEYTPALDYLI